MKNEVIEYMSNHRIGLLAHHFDWGRGYICKIWAFDNKAHRMNGFCVSGVKDNFLYQSKIKINSSKLII